MKHRDNLKRLGFWNVGNQVFADRAEAQVLIVQILSKMSSARIEGKENKPLKQ
jgi:hypothetical protein